jgi:hypothetical protein
VRSPDRGCSLVRTGAVLARHRIDHRLRTLTGHEAAAYLPAHQQQLVIIAREDASDLIEIAGVLGGERNGPGCLPGAMTPTREPMNRPDGG